MGWRCARGECLELSRPPRIPAPVGYRYTLPVPGEVHIAESVSRCERGSRRKPEGGARTAAHRRAAGPGTDGAQLAPRRSLLAGAQWLGGEAEAAVLRGQSPGNSGPIGPWRSGVTRSCGCADFRSHANTRGNLEEETPSDGRAGRGSLLGGRQPTKHCHFDRKGFSPGVEKPALSPAWPLPANTRLLDSPSLALGLARNDDSKG